MCFLVVVDHQYREYFETHSSLIFKWDCSVSHVCKSSAFGMRTLGINLALWRERQRVQLLSLVSCGALREMAAASDEFLQFLRVLRAESACLCLCAGDFFSPPQSSRDGWRWLCLERCWWQAENWERWGIVNTSSLYNVLGKMCSYFDSKIKICISVIEQEVTPTSL